MFEDILDTILKDPLAGARSAPKAVGYAGLDIPADLLAAYDGYVCHLPWDADKPTPNADKWLENAFEPWAKSMLESWIVGEFECFEKVIFTRGSDSLQRLYYYICELQRWGEIKGPEPVIFDVARVQRNTSLERSIRAVRSLAETLGVDEEALKVGIGVVNQRRELFEKLNAVSGSLRDKAVRASLFATIDDQLANLALDDNTKPAVVFAGSAPPDDRLYRVIEEAGFSVGVDCHERTNTLHGPKIALNGDVFEAVGKQVHVHMPGPRSYIDIPKRMMEAAQRTDAKAVILWLVEEDESYLWHARGQQKMLTEAGIPHLVLSRRKWNGSDGAAKEIIEFLKGVPA